MNLKMLKVCTALPKKTDSIPHQINNIRSHFVDEKSDEKETGTKTTQKTHRHNGKILLSGIV